MAGVAGRLRQFWTLSLIDKGLFIVALVMMTIAALAIRLVPIRRIAPHLGQSLGPVGFIPLASPAATARARRLRDSIGRAAKLLPWRADCYPQALTGVMLCRWWRVPVAMHLGMRIDEQGAPHAHAWLVSGRIAVTGGAGFARYTPVACFCAP